MLVKLGEATFINVENTDSVVNDPNFTTNQNSQILSKFAQFTQNLKRIAPKANDFLYFSAVMMHAAEAAAINEDGTLKVLANGEPVQVGWEKTDEAWKWTSNDPGLKPYRNSNRDIFPEEELLSAHKKWVGKPLCIDHKSSSVDHVRGFIVDTYYDHALKRVIALCALDKKNYPDLAHKVSSGYSNNVSMGTAVGRAVCTECCTVARVESDFCNHMKLKSCYGEINLDLSPIELSIVVNGADPKAKIKHIIAAANSLNSYVAKKEEELKKLASITFNANFSIGAENNSESISLAKISTNDLNGFLDGVSQALEKIKSEYHKYEEDGNDLTSNQVGDSNEMASPGVPSSPKFASEEDHLVKELKNITAGIEAKLTNLKQDFQQLSINLQHHKEETMSGDNNLNKSAYYQGAGGVNEPTPGKPKYPADPLNAKSRTDGDKQMFVDNTGPVDGLFPGDLDKKKMLARAEAEERSLRRLAALNAAKEAIENRKTAYFQGGGEGNEPTPGKPKYPVDPGAAKARGEDKPMVGQKPFPDVGAVDGLHPSPASVDEKDELKRKELLRRAGALKAQFVKAANEDGSLNSGDSRWNVFSGDKLILSASVNDIAGTSAELMYDGIATKDFGARLIEKVKTSGVNGTKALFKGGQAAPPAPPAAPEAPVVAPEAPQAPEALADVKEPKDLGGEGSPAEKAMELATSIRDESSDLVEQLNALTGEQAEMGALEGIDGQPLVGKSASAELRSLAEMRTELNGALITATKEAIAELNDSREELELIADMYNSNSVTQSNEKFVSSLVTSAFADAKKSIADARQLMGAFVKYARGTEAMVKRAHAESALRKVAQEAQAEDLSQSDDDLLNLVNSSDSNDADDAEFDALMAADDNDDDDNEGDDNDADALKVNHEDIAKANPGAPTPTVGEEKMVTVAFDLSTKEGRTAYRAKLAADTMSVSPILDQAHPKGGFTTDLDTKVTGDLAHVEDLKEQHKAMMDVATAAPKVRKEAAMIHQLVSEGKLDANDLDSLVSEGLDAETVKYYKSYYGQVDGGKEFANELLKEAAAKAAEEEKEAYRVKLARAYELAYEMVARGLCLNDRDAVSAQVSEIMKFNDDSFDSLKRVIARHQPIQKEASSIPRVGLIGSGEISTKVAEEDLQSQLTAAFSKSPRRMF